MKLGYIAAFLYALLTALSSLFIEDKIGIIGDITTILFLSFLIASIFFHIIGYKYIKKAYRNIIIDQKNYIQMCIYIGIVWILSVYGVLHSNALIFSIFLFMSSALVAHLVSYKKNHQNLLSLGLSIIIILILITVLLQNKNFISGMLLGILAGICAYLYRHVSAKFAINISATTTEVLMVRFIPAALLLLPIINFSSLPTILEQHFTIVLTFSFLSLVIPIFFMQYAVNHIGAVHVSIISATVFPFTWFGDFILHYLHHNNDIKVSDFFISSISLIVIIFPYLYKNPFKINPHRK